MSGSQAKAQRREERFREALLQAHDRLHKDDPDSAHAVIHEAMGIRDHATDDAHDVEPMADTATFDAAFRDLCTTHNVRAAYVSAVSESERGTRLMSGGDADLSAFLDCAMREATERQRMRRDLTGTG